MTRTVRDAALLLDVTGGRMPGDPYDAPQFGREDLLVRVASFLEGSDTWRGRDLPPVHATRR